MSDAPRGVNDEPELSCQCEPVTGILAWWLKAKYKLRELLHPEKPEDSNLYQHAVRELTAAGYFKEENPDEIGAGMNKMMREDVLALMKTFCTQGHSGMSAPFCVHMFADLAMYKPLLPLQGTDDEWMEVNGFPTDDNGVCYQNMRCSHIFKDNRGAYDINAVVYREPDGCTFHRGGEREFITFPYTPTVRYVDVPFDPEDPRAQQHPQLTLALGI